MKEQRAEDAVNGPPIAGDPASDAIGKRTLIDATKPPRAGGPPVLQAKHDATDTDEARKPTRNLSEIAKATIDELDGDRSKKVLLAEILAAARLHELPAFTAILKAAPHGTYGDHFIFLANELKEDWGSQTTVSILQIFADAGIDITSKLDTFDMQPLAAVAQFKSTAVKFRELYQSGDLSRADQQRIGTLLRAAEDAIRSIEGPAKPRGAHGPQVKVAGVGGAAVAAWELAGALAADDVTGIGVADDVAIPFVVVGAIVLTGVAVASGPKPTILDYAPARQATQAAIREMTELLGIATALAVQVGRAEGQLRNVARHLARLFVLAAVGGEPPGEPPKKNNDDDNHWWKEIKASIKQFWQATKGASRRQIMKALEHEFNKEQIEEIEAVLARAEEMMSDQIGKLLPPP